MAEHLSVIDRDRFDPHVVVLNEPPIVEELDDLDIPVTILQDLRYSRSRKGLTQRLTNGLVRRCRWYAPRLVLPFKRMAHGSTIRDVVRITEERGIDLLHLNDQIGRDLFGVVAADRVGIPCISHLRSTRGALDKRSAAYANDSVHAFVANSEATAKYWIDEGLDPDRIHVVPNGIGIRDVEPVDPNSEFGVRDGPTLGCVGNFTEGKGHRFLLRAFDRILDDHPDATLILLGDGALRSQIQAMIDELGLEGHVVLAGYRDDAIASIAGVDVAVIPSRTEAFGRAALEAMMVGTPIVATKVGGLPGIVQDGETGLLVEHGDVEALARSVGDLLDDPDLRRHLSAHARDHVRKNYSIHRYSETVAGLYEECLAAI